ncbi:hypothetical protein CsSME_00010344 [Camellia sinensis var. sinensis]
MEYFCKSMYCPDRGGFFCLEIDCMGLGSGFCQSCKINEVQKEKENFNINSSMTGFTHMGTEYSIHDFVYLGPRHFGEDGKTSENFKGGRNVGLKAYVVCHLLEIEGVKARKQADPESMTVKVRRFFRPEDISPEKAYRSDIQEVYYSEQIVTVPLLAIEGKCVVRRKQDLPFMDAPVIFQHIFFCEYFYDHNNGAIKQLPAHIKLTPSKERVVDDATIRKKKGKCKEGGSGFDEQKDASSSNRLATLDIFAGCGGLSEGVSLTKWAIEYEEPAGEAFKLNHPEALMLINNCNVILRWMLDFA